MISNTMSDFGQVILSECTGKMLDDNTITTGTGIDILSGEE
jgi:hypothetical protein